MDYSGTTLMGISTHSNHNFAYDLSHIGFRPLSDMIINHI